MTYAANLSTIYRNLPRDERAAAAAADGYALVESWWDFDSATPDPRELDAFITSIESAGLDLVALNSHGGNRAAGERGMASLPDRQKEFEASIEGIIEAAERTGTRKFNVAAGNRDPLLSKDEQLDIAAGRYRLACERVERFGGTVLIEALGQEENPGYLFTTGTDVLDFLRDRLPAITNIGLLFDTYHLASNGIDVVAAWHTLHDGVAHLQLADAPGRGAPGTGDIDFDAFLDEVARTGYSGDIALEYLGDQS